MIKQRIQPAWPGVLKLGNMNELLMPKKLVTARRGKTQGTPSVFREWVE